MHVYVMYSAWRYVMHVPVSDHTLMHVYSAWRYVILCVRIHILAMYTKPKATAAASMPYTHIFTTMCQLVRRHPNHACARAHWRDPTLPRHSGARATAMDAKLHIAARGDRP